MNAFDETLGRPLTADGISVLQVNVGLRCNQTCSHCHLECSPARTEAMDRPTMQAVLDVAAQIRPRLTDLTGGAPELHPDLPWFLTALARAGHPTQVRTNLTALLLPETASLAGLFRDLRVRLTASLPCYLEQNVDRMRGAGVFARSIEAMRRLNRLGYGHDPALPLDLVFNHPLGPCLPPDQAALEADYRRELESRHGVRFTKLLTLANAPLGRYLKALKSAGQDRDYLGLLRSSFNPATADGLMCRHQINVGHDGAIYDCDFNQALGLPVNHGAPSHIRDFDPEALSRRRVVTGEHCFVCTAGAGSSCGGALCPGA